MVQYHNRELMSEVIQRIKYLRQVNGITQEDFFNDTGIHLARIESGKSNITISTLGKICKYFSIELKDFFNDFPSISEIG
jgi:transcriptional regulator with XRE-family HTH domain